VRPTRRRRLAFVSPVFLLPADTGGRIRTRNVLRGLRGGAFEVTLASPATGAQQVQHGDELRMLCDHFVPWRPAAERPRWLRAFDLLGELPVNVVPDARGGGRAAVQHLLRDGQFDVVVFDFVHTAVLVPQPCPAPAVCFTHNVEAEIFARHSRTAGHAPMRRVWASQAAKMRRYEAASLRCFERVIAVSERDARHFADDYALPRVEVIPTAVDLEFFAWQMPPAVGSAHPPTVAFTGSMDWAANVDGVQHFLDVVWPRVVARRPDARFVVVGRNPPPALVKAARTLPGVHFPGFVDDVRPHVRAAHAFAIPLRVGGGTRIKAFEAMAMGIPVVSTAIGIEGLDVRPDEHFLLRETGAEQAEALLALFDDAMLRERLSRAARERVESHFGHLAVARVFEQICLRACGDGVEVSASAPVAALQAPAA
jgi:polysaccharide biosynthesis protein PslH